ncbi:hypothetical protein SFC43_05350 [Bacteroides sp. CR5/BHMF/2]|nr:hypothetical protein [Bacteroides sp. CR5/BHMF/2]
MKTKVLPSGKMKTLKTFNNRLQSIKNLRPSEAQGINLRLQILTF